MKKKIIISTMIAFFISFVLGPADLISQLTFGVISAFLCCAALLILARFKFVKSSPNSMHTLVCLLVCIVSVLFVQWLPWLRFQERIAGFINWSPNSSILSSETSSIVSRIGGLWIRCSTKHGGILSKEIESVICSLDSPKIHSHKEFTDTWRFEFSEGNSVEFKIEKDETVWIDKQHRVTFLGPVLNREDISLLLNHPHDKELKISSPEELLNVINKFKDEDLMSGYGNGPERTRGT